MIGHTLGGSYEITGALGRGGMGAVYEARHVGSGTLVAVKVLDPRLVDSSRGITDRFRREARAAASLDSPHVVHALDAGRDAATGALYLVMEHVGGGDLQRVLARTGPLSPAAVLAIAGQALSGLEVAHRAGIIHRDIKPGNLLLARGPDGDVTVKIADFGLAKVVAAPDATNLTGTSDVFGSPLYMSPEQAESTRDVDARADLWSLGGTLYAALAGRAPHAHVTPLRWMILAICTKPAPPLRELAPWVPGAVEALVHRALEIDRHRRFPDATAMLSAVRALAPEGFTLREEMLTSRAPGGGPSEAVTGEETTEPQAPLD